MKNKNVLVTGGSGFIGSHLVDELLKSGYKVTILDLFKSKWLKSNSKFVQGSIEDKKLLSRLIKQNNIVYHFAGISDLNSAYEDPIGSVEKNILCSINILDLCVQHNVDRFVFSSSIYVYSNFGGFYKCSKKAVEDYIEQFSKIFGLKYTILRYGSIYGPRSDNTNAIYSIIKYALKNKKIIYKGNKNSIREYIHIKDVSNISVKILSSKYKNKCVNITGNKKIKISYLLSIISEMLNVKNIKYSKQRYAGHYINTPYNYLPMRAIPYNREHEYDIEQGLIELIAEIDAEIDDELKK